FTSGKINLFPYCNWKIRLFFTFCRTTIWIRKIVIVSFFFAVRIGESSNGTPVKKNRTDYCHLWKIKEIEQSFQISGEKKK
ncbi:hypothetical protein C0J52_12364, partial [Blattella germanica]